MPDEVVENQAPQQAPETEFPLTIEEFVQRLSATDKRVELIHGFYVTEKSQGFLRATESDFRSRFKAFVNKPA